MSVALLFDVSGGELIVILLFVLLFFGSKGLPGIARTMGRTMRQLRDATAEVQREIQRGADEVKQGYEEQRRAFRIEPPENAVPQQPAAPPTAPATPEMPSAPSVDAPPAAPSQG
ncbi:MAG: twin-arginine translocase TatA/TatE family subunit [Flavobacteriales bacterium]